MTLQIKMCDYNFSKIYINFLIFQNLTYIPAKKIWERG